MRPLFKSGDLWISGNLIRINIVLQCGNNISLSLEPCWGLMSMTWKTLNQVTAVRVLQLQSHKWRCIILNKRRVRRIGSNSFTCSLEFLTTLLSWRERLCLGDPTAGSLNGIAGGFFPGLTGASKSGWRMPDQLSTVGSISYNSVQ